MIDDAASRTPLRVATWNLNHWRQPLLPSDTRRAGWGHLADSLHAQVALVQEAVPPIEMPRDRVVYSEFAGHRNWGSAVVALDPAVAIEPIRSVRVPGSRRRHRLDTAHPGSTAVARVNVPGIQPIACVSVYGVFDPWPLASMHRIVADLLPLFDSPDGARVVLGGDLNVTQSSSDPLYLARADALLAAVAALGLIEVKTVVADPPPASVDCGCRGTACSHIGTWGSAELDHLYVSPALVPQVAALAVDRDAVAAGLSDHTPLAVDLELTTERTPHVWDEDAFADEMGRRLGPDARRVVAALVSWAERKEGELEDRAGVADRILTRFPIGGVTAEPELLFTIDIQTQPRSSMVAFSIHADGTVVVWLGGMRLVPYDTEDGRDGLRRQLNELMGVHVHRRELKGWPRFPIERLQDPANLAKFAAMLDRIAEDSHSVPPLTAERQAESAAATDKITPAAGTEIQTGRAHGGAGG